jgi:hypothetical protein
MSTRVRDSDENFPEKFKSETFWKIFRTGKFSMENFPPHTTSCTAGAMEQSSSRDADSRSAGKDNHCLLLGQNLTSSQGLDIGPCRQMTNPFHTLTP